MVMNNITKILNILSLCTLYCFIISYNVIASERVALVIGNGKYKDSPLRNPANDANDMATMLTKLNFDVIKEINVNKQQMISALNRFSSKLKRSQIGLFYFAGHGMQINGSNYLIPVNIDVVDEGDVEFEAVNAARVISKMKSAENKLNVVILDACRNNPFARNFRSALQGLVQMTAPKGTIIGYATGVGEVAEDGMNSRNSPYTKHLLRAMEKPGLNIRDIFNVAGIGVMVETNDRQIPWTSTTPIPDYLLAGGNPDDVVSDAGSGYVAPTKTGKLKVTSHPSGAAISLNGESAGKTPLQLGNLPAGSFHVQVGKSGYIGKRQQVTVKAGQLTVVDVDLVKERKSGTLTVRPMPDNARVRIINIKPLYKPGMELKPGRYHVEVSADGFASNRQWVELSAGDDLLLDVALVSKMLPVTPVQRKQQVEKSVPIAATHQTYTEPITGMEFVMVDGGCYQMGQTEKEKAYLLEEEGEKTYNKYFKRELPRHRVCVDSFYMGRYEVTVGQWRKFIEETGYRSNSEKNREKKGCFTFIDSSFDWKKGTAWNSPGYPVQEDFPVSCVSYQDAKRFIKWLNKKADKEYRLPTEAEWEYAARAGTETIRYWGDVDSDTCSYANVSEDLRGWNNGFPCDDGYEFAAPVGRFKPNSFGMYDMLGNVWEWTGDLFASEYKKKPINNPKGPWSGSDRVLRGGGWFHGVAGVRSAHRSRLQSWSRRSTLGFRLVFVP